MIKLAIKIDFLDKPTGRKKHKRPIPLMGGVGIYIAFFSGYLIFMRPVREEFPYILISSLLVFGIGMIDDWYKTKSKEFVILPRLIIQIVAAIMVYHAGIVFNGFTNPFTHNYVVLPGEIRFLLSITWIFGLRSTYI